MTDTYYLHLDDCELANEIADMTRLQKQNQERLDRLRFVLQQRLEARNATELPHPDLVVKLEYPSPTYDVGKLAALRELVPLELLLESGAWVPEHEEIIHVSEKYDARVFRTWGKKYGDDVARVIEGAKLPGGPGKLRVTEKKP